MLARLSRTIDKPQNAVALGVAVMLLGDFMFALNDVMGKWLVATYTVGQVLLIRSAAALVVLAPMVARTGVKRLVTVEKPVAQVVRVICSSIEVTLFYWAVVYLPIADVMSFYLAGPIWVAAMSPFLLGETVGWRRWTAILIGFGGVLIILNPSGESLSLPALLAIAGSVCYALMVVQSRQLRATPDTTLVFWQTVGALVMGLLLAPFGWVTPTPFDFLLLATLGVVAMTAHMLINRSLKLAPAAVVAPLQYTLLLWAIVFGWLIFDDVPKTSMLIGAAIIVGAGLFIFERQKKLGKEPPVGDVV